MSATKALRELKAAVADRDRAIDEIVAAIAHLPRGATRQGLIRRAVKEAGIARDFIERSIEDARPTWPPESWAAEAKHLRERIMWLKAAGGRNGEIARLQRQLEEATSRSR